MIAKDMKKDGYSPSAISALLLRSGSAKTTTIVGGAERSANSTKSWQKCTVAGQT